MDSVQKKGERIRNIDHLIQVASQRKSVIEGHGDIKPLPAAWIINYPAVYVTALIRSGLYVYIGKRKKGHKCSCLK